jgi:hypothetical protein
MPLPLSTDELVRLAANGGGFEVDVAQFSQADLVRIAANTAASGAKIVIINARHISIDNLVQIAANGKGNIFFQ